MANSYPCGIDRTSQPSAHTITRKPAGTHPKPGRGYCNLVKALDMKFLLQVSISIYYKNFCNLNGHTKYIDYQSSTKGSNIFMVDAA
jgi:hypothetical protein